METILEENSACSGRDAEKAVEEPGDVPQVLYRVARAYFILVKPPAFYPGQCQSVLFRKNRKDSVRCIR